MKKVLITGGDGFIGRYLCRECETQQVHYLIVSNMVKENTKLMRKVDLLDVEELKTVLRDFFPDAIVHLAAIASPVHNDIAEVYRINVGGTENLLKAAAEVLPSGTRVVLTSTAGVYGNQDEEYLHEGLPFNPANHYSCSKMVTEILSRQYHHHLDIRIVRPFNIIGYGQNTNFFIPKLVKSFSTRCKELQLGNLGAVRDYVSVDFCAKVMLDVAINQEVSQKIINICTGVGHSCKQVVEILEKLTEHHPKIVSTAEFSRSNEVWRMVGDTSELQKVVKKRYESMPLEVIVKKMLEQQVM